MPVQPKDQIQVVCPNCGNGQLEPRRAISTTCRKCRQHLLVQELLNPRLAPAPAPALLHAHRRVTCFDCGTEMDVPVAARSSMCKRCSSYLDFQDYSIASTISKSFKTKGRFVVEKNGYVFNTEVLAGEIVIRGRILGKLTAERTLTVHSNAEIQGTFKAPLLVIPADNCFHTRETLRVTSVEIFGELVGSIRAERTVFLRATGSVFGNLHAHSLVVEEGAVLVGQISTAPG
ncbi:MAG: polymer-forming cytoskeletal protein [Verrucomicrobiae bacterium]|nr:polymer-forming cytoskeletal protein [Verrucomicrobiae bacterium]